MHSDRGQVRPNKKLFLEVVRRVGLFCEPYGFVAHPCYPSAWEPANQAYQASLFHSDVSEFIVQLEIGFYPSQASFGISATKSKSDFGFSSVADVPAVAGDWTELWLYQPFDEFSLSGSSPWNPFSKNHFKVSKRKPLNVDKEASKVCAAFERNAHFLFQAIKGEYGGRMVTRTHYEIQRPEADAIR